MNTAESGIDLRVAQTNGFSRSVWFVPGHFGLFKRGGYNRFLDLSFDVFGMTVPLAIAVGVFPYPITFMCTDLISERFGEKKS